jgi:hypothetical protein
MSKPELIIADFEGENARNFGQVRQRLIKGGGWKKQRIVLVAPIAAVWPKVLLSWWNLLWPANQPVVKIMAVGQEVGEAYSQAIEAILAHPDLAQFEYLLTIEHDNTPKPDGVLQLLQAFEERPELHAISGLYFTKGYGGVAQIWGDPNDASNFRPQVPPEVPGVVECWGIGMGFALWRLGMFKDSRLRRPWFKTLDGRDGKGVGTQDLYFWGDARKFGYRCAVDTRVRVGHYDHEGKFGPAGMVW